MYRVLQEIIEILFNNIPFSRKSEIAKYKIKEAFKTKYGEDNSIEVLEEIISHSHSLIEAGKLAGYTESEINLISSQQNIKNKKDLKKLFQKYKSLIICEVLSISYNLFLIINFICCNNVITLILTGIYTILEIKLIFFLKRKKENYVHDNQLLDIKCDKTGEKYIQFLYDRYTKKEINMIFLAIAFISYLIFTSILSFSMFAYNLEDILQQIAYNNFIIFMVTFLLLKNMALHRFFASFFILYKERKFISKVKTIIIFTSIYWLIVIGILFLLRIIVTNIFNLYLVAFIVYALLLLVYNLTTRKMIVFNNITINVKRCISVSVIAVLLVGYQAMSMDLWLTQPYINTVSAIEREPDNIIYNSDSGIYTITTSKENFKILQLTDIHLGGSIFSLSKDLKALEAVEKLITATSPDLVIVTGDLVFPMGVMSYSLNNRAPVMQFASFMRNIGIPWAFTYGNHDTEAMSVITDEQFDELMKSLSYRNSKNLIYPYIQPEIYGRNNQMIEIRKTDGTLMQAIFLLDSNDYIEGGSLNEYDYIHDDQVEWYKKQVNFLSQKEGYTIPSMLFFHMPLQEYKDAYELYENGDSEVQYYYGEIGETMIDKICSSKYPSQLFDTALKLGSTKAMFCGHDHYNNLSVEYKGIRLTYGYSIDYLVMPGIENDTKQRGGTLISIDKNGEYNIEPYRLIDLIE